jgi:hypothetical protein
MTLSSPTSAALRQVTDRRFVAVGGLVGGDAVVVAHAAHGAEPTAAMTAASAAAVSRNRMAYRVSGPCVGSRRTRVDMATAAAPAVRPLCGN